MRRAAAGLAGVLAWTLSGATAPAAAWAQARPSDEEIFGAPAPSAPPEASPSPDGGAAAPVTTPGETPVRPSPGAPSDYPTPPAAGAEGMSRDQAVLGNTSGEPEHLSDYIAPENPLQIGGQLYLRAQSQASQGEPPDQWSFSAPALLDLYLDARPNPRVRAFVLGRMGYDATAATAQGVLEAQMMANQTTGGGGAFSGGQPTGFTTFNATRGPNALLDQMWMRFDVDNRVFLTVGKQHVRWGTGRFWQPTDYLHPIRRNPLDVFDARQGASMLKIHIPWEARAWNFYAFAIADGAFEPNPDSAANTLRQVATAARAEVVLAGVEIGVDAFLKRDEKPRFGLDLSTGIWDFDVYADVALRAGADFPVVTDTTPGAPYNSDLRARFTVAPLGGVVTQSVFGINYSRKYNDNDIYTLGAEYFYNQPGYTDPASYAGLIYNQQGAFLPFTFFYLGRQYGALFASFPAPYSWNYTTFTFSTLGNLSDQSFVSRLDYSVTVLTHLTLQAFFGVQYGNPAGELRFGLNIPAQLAADPNDPTQTVVLPPGPISIPPAIVSFGAALLIKL